MQSPVEQIKSYVENGWTYLYHHEYGSGIMVRLKGPDEVLSLTLDHITKADLKDQALLYLGKLENEKFNELKRLLYNEHYVPVPFMYDGPTQRYIEAPTYFVEVRKKEDSKQFIFTGKENVNNAQDLIDRYMVSNF